MPIHHFTDLQPEPQSALLGWGRRGVGSEGVERESAVKASNLKELLRHDGIMRLTLGATYYRHSPPHLQQDAIISAGWEHR